MHPPRHRDRARRLRPAVLAGALGLVSVAAGAAVLATSARDVQAGYHDTTTAVVELSGAFALEVSGTAPDGSPAGPVAGDPEPLVVRAAGGSAYTTHTPVEWQATVHAPDAAGRVVLTLVDPDPADVVVGGTRYPDLFSTLRFTVLDVTDPGRPVTLAADATAAQVAAAGLTLDVPAGGSRTVAVRAVVAEGTWRLYDGRTTATGLRFSGVGS
ncbi:hypothetical protein [Cellulomonas sp. C5510]|uniref:hypothetical protein n=1 Tax=Cellulomonas sp. C5510 TaxID=2871170 RepID=UPI001C95F463|nr:hypothetical protein [Cellulomonas sp. C5510]QZN85606.1 hypothetical protein K5O09_18055 [Cellulomonas sp. C5510]